MVGSNTGFMEQEPDFRVQGEKSEALERGRRLRDALRKAGGNKAVSQRTGIPTSTLSAYIAGQDWKLSTTMALADACEVDLTWLITGQALTKPQTDQIVNIPAILSKFIMIPRYNQRASTEGEQSVEETENAGLVAFDETFFLRHFGVGSKSFATIEATGDSMEPTIHDGDLLLVETLVNTVRDGSIYVLSVNGMVSVKRLRVQVDGSLAVTADNPRHQTQIVKLSETEPFRIVGRVVYQAGPVRS